MRLGDDAATRFHDDQMDPRFSQLLDRERLNGAYPVRRLFGPPFRGHLVTDYDDTVVAVHDACHYWGGAVDVLLPLRSGHVEGPWRELAVEAALDGVETRGHAGDDVEELLGRKLGERVGDFLLSVLAFSGTKRDEWPQVDVALPAPEDPWFVAYLTALGAWPERPNAQFLDWARLDQDLEWSRVVPVSFTPVSAPGPEDLLRRLRSDETRAPARMTAMLIALSQGPRDQGIGPGATVIPRRQPDLALIGPNVVVVYEPGNVDDLCLIWALRAAHGLNDGLPLAVPVSADVDEVLALFEREHAGVYFGLPGDDRRRWALTSLSLPLEQLSELAKRRSDRWQAKPAAELMQPPRRAARVSSTFVTFVDGEARVDAWGEEDARLFGRWPPSVLFIQAQVNLALEARRLPRSRALAGPLPYDGYYHDGGWQLLARTPPNTRSMRWPSGWTVIEALARDRGLRPSPSTAGAAAATLLRQLGSLAAITAILNPDLVAQLDRLGERRGMSWFRRRARDLAMRAGGDDDQIAAIERGLGALSLRAFEGEGNDLTVNSLRAVLGDRRRASAWIGWALERGLIVQGVEVSCRRCGAKSWRSVQEIAPPVVCRGCGATIERPFPVEQLPFRYRASEALLRLVEADAMSHILALRWWCDLFADPFNKGSYLFGAYPGVDFDASDGTRVGEADVLLVLSDGALVPGECKRTSAGMNQDELAKLDRLADALGSPWTFIATLSPSRNCDEVWKRVADADRGPRPRLVLTGDQLYEPHVAPAVGQDAFAWQERTERDDTERSESWKAQIADRVNYLSEEHDPDAFLFHESNEADESPGDV